jgi:hypothetical protein
VHLVGKSEHFAFCLGALEGRGSLGRGREGLLPPRCLTCVAGHLESLQGTCDTVERRDVRAPYGAKRSKGARSGDGAPRRLAAEKLAGQSQEVQGAGLTCRGRRTSASGLQEPPPLPGPAPCSARGSREGAPAASHEARDRSAL